MRIAVIGSGVAGLGAAWSLSRQHEITLFEAADTPGGHTNTVTVDSPDGPLNIDTGFIVHNPVNYPNLIRMLSMLGVTTQPSTMSFALSAGDGALEYSGGGRLTGLFAQLSLLFRPSHWRMLFDILRFFRLTKQLLANDELPDVTLGQFLDDHGFSDELQRRFLCPMAGAIWSTPAEATRAFPFPAFARFYESHGLLNIFKRPKWRTISGGSRRYVEAMLADFRGELRLSTPVQALRRTDAGVMVTTAAGEERFDTVVCAVHGDIAARMLADADEDEAAVLGGVQYAENRAILHTDTRLMPRRRLTWSSWNVLQTADTLDASPVCLSYWMNLLQALDTEEEYIVTLNPIREPDPRRVLYETVYTHPQYTPAMMEAQRRLPEIQGKRGIWWCGAWTGYGFHEDGFTSGLNVARALGCAPPWEADAGPS